MKATPKPTHPIIQRLAALTRQAGGRKAVSERSGYSPENLWHWFTGRNRMPLIAAIDIAESLGYSLILVPKETQDVHQTPHHDIPR